MRFSLSTITLSVVLSSAILWPSFAQTRDLPSFSGIKLSLSSSVVVKQGSPQSVRLEGQDRDLEHIETVVRDGNLVIKTFENNNWGNSNMGKVTLYITVPELESVSVSGSGSVESDGRIKAHDLSLKVSGSGNIDMEADVEELESRISGSGKISLTGNTITNEISITGSGKLNADQLKSKECDIRISGSGDCRVDVTAKLDVKVSGSGNVYYRGDPERVNSNISGSGDLRRLN